MPLRQLTQVLRGVSGAADPRLLVGPRTVDDAGVVLLGGGEGVPADARALVQTVDYFPPIVDDPWYYGAIAAANALSDVYAMGGRPFSALNLAGFPEGFDEGWIGEIFRGGFEKVRESGAVVAGGHTVQVEEPHFGFAVTGLVDPDRVVTNAEARPGDRLYLTKPLGMGSLTTGAKLRKLAWADLEPAARVMATLNRAASEAMLAARASACTDVTGFGLVGHGRNVALASGVTLRFVLADLPFAGGALELARRGVFSGAMRRGRASMDPEVRLGPNAERARVDIAFDAETSGGLLIAIAPARADALERELASRDVPVHAVGEVLQQQDRPIELT